MRRMPRLGLCWIVVAALFFSLTGCELLNFFWPQNIPQEISAAFPEEVLKEAEELEEAAEFFDSFVGEDSGVSAVPIGEFTLNYFLNYRSEYLNAKSKLLEKITLAPDKNQVDYSKAVYYFDQYFTGKQTGELAGQDEGVICWVMFEHEVNYHVNGSFDPVTCTLKVNIDAEPLKTVETGTSCPHYPAGILTLDQLFLATPDTEISITEVDNVITFEVWHQLMVSDFTLNVKGINCPMK